MPTCCETGTRSAMRQPGLADSYGLSEELQAGVARVVRDGGTEVRPPCRFTVVAVRAWIGQNIDPPVPDLHRKRIGVGVRGDAEISVRTPVTAAPYFRLTVTRRAQQGNPGIRELPNTLSCRCGFRICRGISDSTAEA